MTDEMDTGALAILCATTMDQLQACFDAEAQIRTVMIVVEVTTDDPGDPPIVLTCNENRPYVQEAFLDRALDLVAAQRVLTPTGDQDDE
jgi:hypothetical protein